MFGVGPNHTDEPKLCPSARLAQVFTFTFKHYISENIVTNEGSLHYSFSFFIGEGSLDHHQLVEVRIAQVVL